ncbi:DUF5819 family protein [Streptomyces sp. 2A115]|uniref:DUF5819 family protein n=1 Tax=Streptomyces sp. 2A115 TaxID=3457439 RepID=UPI003FD18BB9
MDAYDKGSNARPVPSEPAAPDLAPAPASAPEPGSAAEPAPGAPDGPPPDSHAGHAGHAASGDGPAGPPSLIGISPSGDGPAGPSPVTGIAALSLRYQIAAALALAVVAVAACVHVGMVFLHVAPSNTVTKQHGRAIDEWVYPEFEQNWKLFAPNPLQQNISVQVRAEVRTSDADVTTTGWYDLSARDGAAIDANLLPSHTQQNELRRAWDFYVATHDNENRPSGLRGALSERYLRRIVVLRLDRERAGGRAAVVQQVQVRSRTTNVPSPKWSKEQVSDKPMVRQLPWWPVSKADRPAGTRPTESTEASAG